MESTKNITKKLGDKTFIWDPTAYSNKGYWYILGKEGAFGRPASKEERTKLGEIKKEQTEPVSPKVYEEDKTPKEVIKTSISSQLKRSTLGIKEKFDPLNLSRALFGDRLTAILGRKLGRNEEDIDYFTGYSKKTRAVSNTTKITALEKNIAKALYTKVSSNTQPTVRVKDNVATVLTKLYVLIKKNHDEEIKLQEISRNKSKAEELKNTRNEELIEALTGRKKSEEYLTVKTFNKFEKDLTKKLKQIVSNIKENDVSTIETVVKSVFGTTILRALPFVAGPAALVLAAIAGVVLQKEQKEEIQADPFNPNYDNIPYALTLRGVGKNDRNSAKILQGRALKQFRYPDVEELYKIDPVMAEDEIGLPKEKIKEFLDDPSNKNKSIQGIPKSERDNKKVTELSNTQDAGALSKDSTSTPSASPVDNKVVSDKLTPTPSMENKASLSTPSIPPMVEKNEDSMSVAEQNMYSSVTQLNSSPRTSMVSNTIGENNSLNESRNSNRTTVLADNSSKINIINNNSDGLLVEQITGVRLEETTLKKITKINLRMV
jgi:hypothetical protein